MGVAVRQSTAFLAVLVTLLWMAVCAVSVAYYRLMCALHAKDPRGERHGRRRSSGGLQMTAAARMRAPLLLNDGSSAGGGSAESEVGRAFATYALQRAVAKARKVERAAKRATAAIVVLGVALAPPMLLNFILSLEGKPPVHATALYQTLAMELLMPLSVMVVLFFAAAYSLTAEEVFTRRFLSVWFALMILCMACYTKDGTQFCPGLFHSGWPDAHNITDP